MIFKKLMLICFIFSSYCAVAITQKKFQQLRDPFHYFTPTSYHINFVHESISTLILLGSMHFGDTAYALIASKKGGMHWVKSGEVVGIEKATVIHIFRKKVQLKEKENATVKLWEIKTEGF